MASAKEYYEGVLKQAGVAPEKQQAFLSAFDDEISKVLQAEAIAPKLRQDDYSRNMDALRKKEAESVAYYQKLLGWESEVKANAEKLAAYEAAYGQLDGNGQRQPVVQQVQQPDFSALKKEWQDELAKRDGQVIGLLKTGMAIASQHAAEFKERLDVDALEKIATEKQMSLQAAYDEFVRPRREEKSLEARKHELQQAREEAVRDFATKQHIPVDAGRPEYHPFFNPGDAKQQIEYTPNTGRLTPVAERTLRSNFVDEWNKAGSGTSGT